MINNNINNNIPFIYKYRPKYIKDFEINSKLKYLLFSLINNNNLNILFVGNPGVGKTSLIDAIIREYYNDNNYFTENILTINNLKEQGIQYYRNEVKTFCQIPCLIPGKKKFIILDDIDYINEQSQQVFRNYMDKYSHNVNFISSCINIQKVIDTLQSRKVIISLPIYTSENMLFVLNNITNSENLAIDLPTSQFIVKISNNSLRIMINYLEKLKIIDLPINIELIRNICSNISHSIFDDYTNLILQKDLNGAINIFYTLYDCGYSTMDIYDNYFLYIKISSIIHSEEIRYKIIKLLCKYITIFHNVHEDEIELALITNEIIKVITYGHKNDNQLL